mmetsp:Transcript_17880/g.30666  ORF Transcript_17880/g.30666 Transcript_17880/m.30666 type:complete len:206 (-) Transcript_17880:187-804(-)|eukprot:CAMPEP_0119103370 /NCGR_PEP_ID=MMETSP1180-20130426/1811_1 /TAXON_ID=3052 ORGANISM="Chlamydomonas cf sp, Strain CCMP681" /NCGR_SAMPLE_ID=MMETSP1180 /ASSEMBLY_ACC=CAM_ASM_000741 /LENGTH=205 /DNA_ID=CAMNT_0007087845 /DNA_START=266 /DNA_END=883 /DNA_ORIENTATION=+
MERQKKTVKITGCGLRVGSKYGKRTAGATWAMCSCGFLFPAVEMPDAESTRMTLLTILRYFKNCLYPRRPDGTRFVIVYDDMCHLLRWALKRKHLHVDINRFCAEPHHAVDKFHFIHNHKGLWCEKMVNPLSLPALDGINTEVCEQRFKHINKFSSMLRPMRRERFNWLLLTIVEADHRMRASGLLKPGKPRKAAYADEAEAPAA